MREPGWNPERGRPQPREQGREQLDVANPDPGTLALDHVPGLEEPRPWNSTDSTRPQRTRKGSSRTRGGVTAMQAVRPPPPAWYPGPVQATDAAEVGKRGNGSQTLPHIAQSSV